MKREMEQSSYWFVLQPGWCQFSATAFTRKSPWQITVVPPPLQASILFFGGLSSSVSHLSGYQRGNTPATSRAGNIVGQGCYFTWLRNSSAKTEISAVSLCVSDPFPFLTVFVIFHNDANKLKGSKRTLRQISLQYQTSQRQPSKEPMKSQRTLILNGFS